METYVKPEERELLDSVTVVICSYSRPEELRETLSFLGLVGLKAIAVDGSPLANEVLMNHESTQMIYIHAPDLTYVERMGAAAKLITTPYALSMSDDEYYIPSAIASSVRFLNSNSDYSSCTGEAVGFLVESGHLKFRGVYPELRDFSMTSNNAVIRMRKHLSNYRVASYYSVVRAEVWSRVWSEISKGRFSPLAIPELQFEASVSFSGKLMVLPILMWWRNSINTPVRALSDPDDLAHVTFFEWWTSKDFREEKQDFLKWTTKFMSGSLSTSQADLDPTYLREAHRAYRNYFYAHSPRLWYLRDTFMHILSRTPLYRDFKLAVSSEENLRLIFPSSTSLDYNWIREISGRIKRFYELS